MDNNFHNTSTLLLRPINLSNFNIGTLSHLYANVSSHSIRSYSTNAGGALTHVDESGKASMVDVTDKKVTVRHASAKAVVQVGHHITKLIKENALKKGDVLTVAQIAGILGAKKTAEIIPLCHNIPLTKIKVSAYLDEVQKNVVIIATVHCQGKTGVEMEALTAVSVSALTVYDMCKAVSHNIKISDIFLLSKSGGSKGNYEAEEIVVKGYETTPIDDNQVVLSHI